MSGPGLTARLGALQCHERHLVGRTYQAGHKLLGAGLGSCSRCFSAC